MTTTDKLKMLYRAVKKNLLPDRLIRRIAEGLPEENDTTYTDVEEELLD